jgi:hypothetical protein
MMLDSIGALIPPIGVGFLFFVVIRAMITADRRERIALAKMEAAEDRAAKEADPGPTS